MAEVLKGKGDSLDFYIFYCQLTERLKVSIKPPLACMVFNEHVAANFASYTG